MLLKAMDISSNHSFYDYVIPGIFLCSEYKTFSITYSNKKFLPLIFSFLGAQSSNEMQNSKRASNIPCSKPYAEMLNPPLPTFLSKSRTSLVEDSE